MDYPGKRILAVLIVPVVLMATAPGYAATVNVPATATVTAATLTLTKVTDINFGSIVSSTAASTIRLNASTGAATPSVTAGSASVSGGTSGLVTVGTNINATVTISYAIESANTTPIAEAIGVSGTAGTSMAITDASITTNSTASPKAITVAGPNQIHIGGELTVGANQAAGTYAGTCVCTVIY
ncbi:MAG: DUF4402 domain-containing protein [Desulfobacteraceae bacterium]|nr:DUF4402 domain-containing protein [Desulfobacteraceae bacterium]